MPSLEDLLNIGYFARELPPPFTYQRYGTIMANTANIPVEFVHAFVSKPCGHNLARSRSSRRELSIPNPVNYYQLASQIAADWNELITIPNQSTISLSKPVDTEGLRAINRLHDINELEEFSARYRSTARYALIADVSRCYPSIYTHSIAWALHTKPIAKANRNDQNLVGVRIDRLIRNGQDQQTMGIPIGPDSSHLISEIVLRAPLKIHYFREST